MNDTSSRSFMKRKVEYPKTAASTKPRGRTAQWERQDEQLDDALRQTFPASDALSIVQSGRVAD